MINSQPYQIKNYIIAPNKNCIPLDWKDVWYEDSEIIIRKDITIGYLFKFAFGLSGNFIKRNISSIEVNDEKISEDMILEKGLYKIKLGRRCINVWYCDYEHTYEDRIYHFIDKVGEKLCLI